MYACCPSPLLPFSSEPGPVPSQGSLPTYLIQLRKSLTEDNPSRQLFKTPFQSDSRWFQVDKATWVFIQKIQNLHIFFIAELFT